MHQKTYSHSFWSQGIEVAQMHQLWANPPMISTQPKNDFDQIQTNFTGMYTTRWYWRKRKTTQRPHCIILVSRISYGSLSPANVCILMPPASSHCSCCCEMVKEWRRGDELQQEPKLKWAKASSHYVTKLELEVQLLCHQSREFEKKHND